MRRLRVVARADLGNRWTIAVIIGAGVAVGVMDSAQAYVLHAALGHPLPWIRVLLTNVTYWVTFAALVPVVFVLAARFPLNGQVRSRNVLAHALASLSFTIVHNGLYALVDPVRPRTPGAFRPWFIKVVRDYAAIEFVSYWMIIAAYHTIYYYRESRQREVTAARLQASLTEARLQALRSQLNPHFLFNTLNTISVLALKGERNGVVEMLGRLSDLLRISLDDKCPQEIPLAKEMEFLDGYLAIQKIRFADRLMIRHDVAADTLQALVPPMMLQPLVENAVVHGIAGQRGPGVITIQSSRENGALRLRVCDTGPGFGRTAGAAPFTGIGLANTHARLEQLYGSRQQIECGYSAESGGTVTITIPFRSSAVTVDPT